MLNFPVVMTATSGLMAVHRYSVMMNPQYCTQTAYFKKVSGAYANNKLLPKLPKRIIGYDCPCSGRPSSCRFTGSDLLHLESPKGI